MDISLLAHNIAKKHIAVIGDLLVDIDHKGDVERLAQEAPTPILAHNITNYALGGAGNVCQNIVGLGSQCSIISVSGDDECASILDTMLEKANINAYIYKDTSRKTTQKQRFHTRNQQLFRMDIEDKTPISNKAQNYIMASLRHIINDIDIIILSDYAKGCLSAQLNHDIISLSHNHGKQVIIDPIGYDYTLYQYADYITPNLKELQDASHHDILNNDDVTKSARHLINQHHIGAILATRSEDGLSFIHPHYQADFATAAQDVFDVTGAGDTVTAVFSIFIALQLSPIMAARYANNAGGIAVAKHGTYSVSLSEVIELYCNTMRTHQPFAYRPPQSRQMVYIDNDETLYNHIQAWRDDGHNIIFSNGCFDLLHDGHLELLTQLAALDGKVIIGLNSDASIARLKGDTRPVISYNSRIDLLSGINLIDAIIMFDSDTPLQLIETIKPDILVKGQDYQKHNIVGADIVEAYGGTIYRASLKDGHSSTYLYNILHDMHDD